MSFTRAVSRASTLKTSVTHRRAASTRSATKRSRQGPLRDLIHTSAFSLLRLRVHAPMLESLPPVWLRRASARASLTETPRGDLLARQVGYWAAAVDGGQEQADVELINSGQAWIGSLEPCAPRALRSDSSSSVVSHPPPYARRARRVGSEPRRTFRRAIGSGYPRRLAPGTWGEVRWRPQAAQVKFEPGEESRIHTETEESRFGRAEIAWQRNASDDFHRSCSPSAAPSW